MIYVLQNQFDPRLEIHSSTALAHNLCYISPSMARPYAAQWRAEQTLPSCEDNYDDQERRMKKIEAIIKPFKLEEVRAALTDLRSPSPIRTDIL